MKYLGTCSDLQNKMAGCMQREVFFYLLIFLFLLKFIISLEVDEIKVQKM